LKDKVSLVLSAVSNPDEAYVDASFAVHVLKRLAGEVSDFLVVIYNIEAGRGYIRTTSCLEN